MSAVKLQPRIHPSEAARIVAQNVLRRFEPVPAGKDEYLQALAWARDGAWSGAKIYDALPLA